MQECTHNLSPPGYKYMTDVIEIPFPSFQNHHTVDTFTETLHMASQLYTVAISSDAKQVLNGQIATIVLISSSYTPVNLCSALQIELPVLKELTY